jgi:hypothetical protein
MKILSKFVRAISLNLLIVPTCCLGGISLSEIAPAQAAIPCRNTYGQDFSWRQLKRTGRVLIKNNRTNPIQITLIHPDSASKFASWTIAPSNQTFLVNNNQNFYVGDDWGIQINGGCVFYVGEVGIYNSQVYEVTLSNPDKISLSGLVAPYSPQSQPQPSNILPPETSPQVIAQNYVDMGGGWGGAKATLNRDGFLVIEGQAVSNANNTATRTSVFVVGSDRRGRTLFVSKKHDIRTACGRWDPTCPSKTASNFTENISPDLAKYVAQLNVYADQHGSTGFQASLNRINQNIKAACASYDDLPVAARAAIAYETGFPGCNPGR